MRVSCFSGESGVKDNETMTWAFGRPATDAKETVAGFAEAAAAGGVNVLLENNRTLKSKPARHNFAGQELGRQKGLGISRPQGVTSRPKETVGTVGFPSIVVRRLIPRVP